MNHVIRVIKNNDGYYSIIWICDAKLENNIIESCRMVCFLENAMSDTIDSIKKYNAKINTHSLQQKNNKYSLYFKNKEDAHKYIEERLIPEIISQKLTGIIHQNYIYDNIVCDEKCKYYNNISPHCNKKFKFL